MISKTPNLAVWCLDNFLFTSREYKYHGGCCCFWRQKKCANVNKILLFHESDSSAFLLMFSCCSHIFIPCRSTKKLLVFANHKSITFGACFLSTIKISKAFQIIAEKIKIYMQRWICALLKVHPKWSHYLCIKNYLSNNTLNEKKRVDTIEIGPDWTLLAKNLQKVKSRAHKIGHCWPM